LFILDLLKQCDGSGKLFVIGIAQGVVVDAFLECHSAAGVREFPSTIDQVVEPFKGKC